MPRPVTLKKLKLNGFLGRGCKRMTELTFCWTYIMVAKLNQHSIRLFHTTFQILATLHPHSWYSSNELERWSNCPLKIKVVFHHFRLCYHSYLPTGSCNTWMDSCPWGWGQYHSLSLPPCSSYICFSYGPHFFTWYIQNIDLLMKMKGKINYLMKTYCLLRLSSSDKPNLSCLCAWWYMWSHNKITLPKGWEGASGSERGDSSLGVIL